MNIQEIQVITVTHTKQDKPRGEIHPVLFKELVEDKIYRAATCGDSQVALRIYYGRIRHFARNPMESLEQDFNKDTAQEVERLIRYYNFNVSTEYHSDHVQYVVSWR
jgi:hypothetical protein